MNLFENERNTRIYNISREITTVFKNFLGVEETKEAIIGHLKQEVEELISAKTKKIWLLNARILLFSPCVF